MASYVATSRSGSGPFYSLSSGDTLSVPAGVTLTPTPNASTYTPLGAAVDGGPDVAITISGAVNGLLFGGYTSHDLGFSIGITAGGSVTGTLYNFLPTAPYTSYAPGDIVLNNAGSLAPTAGSSLFGGLTRYMVTNSGTISGPVALIGDRYGVSGVFTNSGTVSSVGSSSPALTFGGNAAFPQSRTGTLSDTATGHITPDASAASTIEVSGAVSLTLNNAGSIDAPSNAISLHVSSGSLSLTNTGMIAGDTDVSGALTLNNSGTLHNVSVTQSLSLVNSGSIGLINAASVHSAVTITNTGTITGSITLGDGGSFFNDQGGTLSSYVLLGDGASTFVGGAGAEAVGGGAGNDTLYGGGGPDQLRGGGGDDVLVGQDGDDSLYGDAGDNVLSGGPGNDGLTGGSGYNLFTFYSSNFGHDTITDFKTSGYGDHIQFQAGTFSSYSDVVAAMTQSGSDVIIMLNAQSDIRVIGVTIASLTADHFIFG